MTQKHFDVTNGGWTNITEGELDCFFQTHGPDPVYWAIGAAAPGEDDDANVLYPHHPGISANPSAGNVFVKAKGAGGARVTITRE